MITEEKVHDGKVEARKERRGVGGGRHYGDDELWVGGCIHGEWVGEQPLDDKGRDDRRRR